MNSFEDVDSSSSEEGGASEEQDRCSDRLSQKKYYRLNDLRKQSRSHERNRANVINDRRRENSCTTSPRKESGDMGGLFMRWEEVLDIYLIGLQMQMGEKCLKHIYDDGGTLLGHR